MIVILFFYEDGIKYILYGTTLWSNILLEHFDTVTFNDFKLIKTKSENKTVGISKQDFLFLHKNSVEKLYNFINNIEIEPNQKIIVLSHFPPISEGTSHSKYNNQEEWRKSYFSNNLLSNSNIDFSKIGFWISGHTHYSYDFYINSTRFISNQKGYTEECIESGYNTNGVFVM